MVAFPLPEMPGTEDKEALVGQLLRKKPEVGVEEWVAEGRGLGAEVVAKDEVLDMWAWAMVRANEEARRWEWMTAERTPGEMETEGGGGKEEKMGEGEEEEEEEEAEGERREEETLGVEEMLRFMSTGAEGGRR